MNSNIYHILTGQANAQKGDADLLKQQFQDLINTCNDRFRKKILSPYSISLGNEFIGVADSQKSMLETIFYLDEESLNRRHKFQVNYVALEGSIDTPINKVSTHGMIGEGLTVARSMLAHKSRAKLHFQLRLTNDDKTNSINKLLTVLDGIKSKWNVKDGPLIVEMVNHERDSVVSDIFKKNRSQIWKRRKSLLINEYCIIKDFILDLATGVTDRTESQNK